MQGYGIQGRRAPELRVPEWLANTGGNDLQLADITEPIIVLYNFQSWCPGCHSHGFPSIIELRDGLRRHGIDHDAGHPPTVMADYLTGGTPWTVIIGPERTVLHNSFHIDAEQLLPAFARIIEHHESSEQGRRDD